MNNSGEYNLNHPEKSIPLGNILEESQTTPPTNELIKFITVNELSNILSMSSSMIYKLVEEESIPCCRFGRAVRFNTHEIEEWLDSQRIQPKPSSTISNKFGRDVDKILRSTIMKAGL